MSATFKQSEINIREKLSQIKPETKRDGWQDLIAPFINANAGGTVPPSWEAMGANGHYGMRFTDGESLFVTFHILHDFKVGAKVYPHIHFLCDIAMTAGDTVTWKIHYTIAKGHQQGESLTGTRTTITLVYTADGTEVAGEHIVLEATDAQALPYMEPDTLMHCEFEMDSELVTGTAKIFGLQGDLHYQSDDVLTNEKTAPFTKVNT